MGTSSKKKSKKPCKDAMCCEHFFTYTIVLGILLVISVSINLIQANVIQ